MAYELRDGLSYCVVDERCYFIDLTSNRYFALSRQLSAALLQLQSGEHRGGIEPGLAHLVENTANGSDRLAPFMPIPLREIDAGEQGRPSTFAAIPTLAAYLAAPGRTSAVPLLTLARKLDAARNRTPATNRRGSLARVAGVVAAAKALVGDHDLCLRWSYVTARMLIRAGYPARMVFGISAQPFSAHCWAQSEDIVVGDELERVRMYTL
jgi:hypothetical protein